MVNSSHTALADDNKLLLSLNNCNGIMHLKFLRISRDLKIANVNKTFEIL